MECANNASNNIADYKCGCKISLPLLDSAVSGSSYGQDNELDTYKVAQLGPNTLSRISQYLLGILNVVTGRPYCDDCQKPFTCFNIDNTNTQGPKATNPNRHISQPRDLTAYGYNLYLLRGRSFHSSVTAKEGSRKSLIQSKHDSDLKDPDSLNLAIGSDSTMSVSS